MSGKADIFTILSWLQKPWLLITKLSTITQITDKVYFTSSYTIDICDWELFSFHLYFVIASVQESIHWFLYITLLSCWKVINQLIILRLFRKLIKINLDSVSQYPKFIILCSFLKNVLAGTSWTILTRFCLRHTYTCLTFHFSGDASSKRTSAIFFFRWVLSNLLRKHQVLRVLHSFSYSLSFPGPFILKEYDSPPHTHTSCKIGL